jgi:hypothetical protein
MHSIILFPPFLCVYLSDILGPSASLKVTSVLSFNLFQAKLVLHGNIWSQSSRVICLCQMVHYFLTPPVLLVHSIGEQIAYMRSWSLSF